MQLKQFTFNPFMENTYVLYDKTRECIVVDPGCLDEGEQNQLSSFIESENLIVKQLINTHCHIDHVLGNKFVKEKYAVELVIHEIEASYLAEVKNYASIYGIEGYEEATPDKFMEEGDIITFGETSLDVIFVPGHSAGHVALVNKEEAVCMGGDVIFRDSIGRTDLPGGDYDTLIKSIQQKIFKLDDETVIFSGHGPETTVEYEKKNNPFCKLSE